MAATTYCNTFTYTPEPHMSLVFLGQSKVRDDTVRLTFRDVLDVHTDHFSVELCNKDECRVVQCFDDGRVVRVAKDSDVFLGSSDVQYQMFSHLARSSPSATYVLINAVEQFNEHVLQREAKRARWGW